MRHIESITIFAYEIMNIIFQSTTIFKQWYSK